MLPSFFSIVEVGLYCRKVQLILQELATSAFTGLV